MLAELVLVTRLLGLVNGEYPVSIYTDPKIRRVELLRNGEKVATVSGPPWQTIVNFGAELVPQELTAIGYDAAGNPIARDTQLVNLPRPAAEATIDLRREGNTLRATARWQHIGSAQLKDVQWKLDGKAIGGEISVLLPPLESKQLHVIEVEVTFWDNVVARKERVFGGQFSEEVPTELTGAVVRVRKGSTDPAACFQLDGTPVPAAAVEKGDTMVLFVRSPDPKQMRRAFRGVSYDTDRIRYNLDDINVRIMWPSAVVIHDKERRAATNLFEHSEVVDGKIGTYQLLTGRGGPKKNDQRYADAVAVAGVYAAVGARRRAVVLVIGKDDDKSKQNAAVVRRYLERIGVPLKVWSLIGVKKEVTDVWGEVIDVSTAIKLNKATDELRQEIERQRVAWLPLQPLEALKVQTADACGFEPVAKP